MSFEALLADLETLQKAMPPATPPPHDEPDEDNAGGAADGDEDDEAIRAAAGGDADGDGLSDDDDLPELDDDSEGKGEGDDESKGDQYFGKAFAMIAPDGTEVEAYDGTQMMKGFHQRLSSMETDVVLTLQKQTRLIKSLHQEVTRLKEQGKGRKTVVNIHDKPVGHFSSPAPEPQNLLAKALSAQKAGKITGQDVARVETYLGRGLALPADLAALLN